MWKPQIVCVNILDRKFEWIQWTDWIGERVRRERVRRYLIKSDYLLW